MKDVNTSDFAATLAGFASIALWSTTMGLSRICSESLGVLTSGGSITLAAGVMGSIMLFCRGHSLKNIASSNAKYLYGCGALFVLYAVSIYSAVGFAANRSQVLEVSVINYLWPSLTQVLALWIFRYHSRWWLFIAMAVAFGGVVMALTPAEGYSLASIKANVSGNFWPYLLALMAAVGWAAYSNLAKLWSGGLKTSGVSLFFVVSGIVMLILARVTGEHPQWSVKIAALALVMAAGPALAAYHLWDIAMRKGNMHLVVSAAYLTPVLSMIVSCLVFKTLGSVNLWLGCALVVVGAIACAKSVYNSKY